jgi:hypothetical protein
VGVAVASAAVARRGSGIRQKAPRLPNAPKPVLPSHRRQHGPVFSRARDVQRERTAPAVVSGGYRFEADTGGRAARVSGTLRLQPDQRRSRRNQRDAGKPDRLDSDHGGHFIAREFGGPEIALNHFAQDAGVNRGEYRSLELSWKADLKRGKRVTVEIKPIYLGRARRPSSLRVTYVVNGRRIFRKIPNQPRSK